MATVVVFWAVFYAWIGFELWLGYRRRQLPSGAVDRDSGSKAWVIGSVWTTAALGIRLAFGFPEAAIKTGRSELFVAGIVLMLAGIVLRWLRSGCWAPPSPSMSQHALVSRWLSRVRTGGSATRPTPAAC